MWQLASRLSPAFEPVPRAMSLSTQHSYVIPTWWRVQHGKHRILVAVVCSLCRYPSLTQRRSETDYNYQKSVLKHSACWAKLFFSRNSAYTDSIMLNFVLIFWTFLLARQKVLWEGWFLLKVMHVCVDSHIPLRSLIQRQYLGWNMIRKKTINAFASMAWK